MYCCRLANTRGTERAPKTKTIRTHWSNVYAGVYKITKSEPRLAYYRFIMYSISRHTKIIRYYRLFTTTTVDGILSFFFLFLLLLFPFTLILLLIHWLNFQPPPALSLILTRWVYDGYAFTGSGRGWRGEWEGLKGEIFPFSSQKCRSKTEIERA